MRVFSPHPFTKGVLVLIRRLPLCLILLFCALAAAQGDETVEYGDFESEEQFLEYLGGMEEYSAGGLETAIDSTPWIEPLEDWVIEGVDVMFYAPDSDPAVDYYNARLYSVYLYYEGDWGGGGGTHLTNKTEPVEERAEPVFNLEGDIWTEIDEELYGITQYYYDEVENVRGPYEGDGYLFYELDSWGIHYVEIGFPADEQGYVNFCVECDGEWWPELESEIWSMLHQGIAACREYISEQG